MLSSSIQATLIGRYGQSDYGKSKLAGEELFFSYGKETGDAIEIGSMLAASVITSSENVCPRFQPAELGLDV